MDLSAMTPIFGYPTLVIFAEGRGIATARALIEAEPDVGGLSFKMRSDVRLYYRVRHAESQDADVLPRCVLSFFQDSWGGRGGGGGGMLFCVMSNWCLRLLVYNFKRVAVIRGFTKVVLYVRSYLRVRLLSFSSLAGHVGLFDGDKPEGSGQTVVVWRAGADRRCFVLQGAVP